MNQKGFYKIAKRWMLITGVLIMASRTGANEANYRTFIVGDRAAGMGGAACALADSLDAAFYNPAGLARTKYNSVSVSASLYGFDRYEEHDSLFPMEDLKTDSFMTIPSSMGSVFVIGTNTTAAFSVFIPSRSMISEIVAFWDNQHFYNFHVDDQTLWAGPSLGYALSPEFSIGASVFGVYRTYTHFENIYLGSYPFADDYDFKLSQSLNLKHQNLGLLSTIGAQYRPDDRWHFGMAFQSPSVNIWGDGKLEAHHTFEDDTRTETLVKYAEKMNSNNQIPARFTAGAGWQKPTAYAVAADVSYHLSTSFTRLDGNYKDGEHVAVRSTRESVLDLSLGGEYYVRGIYPLRCGFFTSFSSAPDQDVEHLEYPSQIDLYGITASAGVERERVTLNIGISYAFGSGKGLGWDVNEDGELVSEIVNARSSHIFLFVNTSYMF